MIVTDAVLQSNREKLIDIFKMLKENELIDLLDIMTSLGVDEDEATSLCEDLLSEGLIEIEIIDDIGDMQEPDDASSDNS